MDMFIGEALDGGDDMEVAHIDLIIGSKDGPAGVAFANALARQSDGHSNLLAVLEPNLAVYLCASGAKLVFLNMGTRADSTVLRITSLGRFLSAASWVRAMTNSVFISRAFLPSVSLPPIHPLTKRSGTKPTPHAGQVWP